MYTDTCLAAPAPNGSRFQPAQRASSARPATRAIRSSSGALPLSDSYRYELKCDGYRALVEVKNGDLVGLWSRRGRNMAPDYPVLREMPSSLRRRSLVLDGELVGIGSDGRPRFQRMQLGENVVLVVFDVLSVDEKVVVDEDYDSRRRRLEDLGIAGERRRTLDVFDDGQALSEATREQGLEGVVAKRRDSRYECGRRSGAWIKQKHRRRGTFIVGGWMPESSNPNVVGSLLVGSYDEGGRLVYRGRVAGFDARELEAMGVAFPGARQDRSPFEVGAPPHQARFLAPALCVDVSYQEVTEDGQLRHPTFERFRFDLG
jgi:bifunctional non-homologous end joining protein LigD